MKYIYDLKRIEAEAFSRAEDQIGSYKFQALLAIAERLEALVELDARRNELHAETVAMQKQMLKRKSVSEVKEDPAYIEAINNLADSLQANPEVLAKLRGDA